MTPIKENYMRIDSVVTVYGQEDNVETKQEIVVPLPILLPETNNILEGTYLS